jgi:lantibiotic modifying enzyme
MKQLLVHDITLQRPKSYETSAYDDYAKRVIKSLLVRLSILPNTQKNSVKAFVSGLSPTGEIQIKVAAIALRSHNMPAESTRQAFLLAIHNSLCSMEAEEATKALQSADNGKSDVEAEMTSAALAGN